MAEGLYLEPETDTVTYTGTALSVDNDIVDDDKATGARAAIWIQHYSYGIDVVTDTSLVKLEVSCRVTEEGTPLTVNGWVGTGDAFSVYGALDGAPSTWTLIEAFSAPPQTDIVSGRFTFVLAFATPTTAYRYFKVVATEADGCEVTTTSGTPAANISEVDAFEGISIADGINITESVDVYAWYRNISVSDSIDITEVVDVVREDPRLPTVTDDIVITDSPVVLLPFIGNGAIDFPEFELEGYGGGTGAIDFPEFELAGTGFVGVVGEGAIDFPEFELEGYGGGSGAIEFPDFELAGTGMVSIVGHGAINFPEFELDGTGYIYGGHGAIYFPRFELYGEGTVGITGDGAILFPYPQLEGEGFVGGYGEGAIDFPDFELAGAGHCTLAGEGAIDFPEFKLSGSGYVGDLHDDTILEHQRDERFIT